MDYDSLTIIILVLILISCSLIGIWISVNGSRFFTLYQQSSSDKLSERLSSIYLFHDAKIVTRIKIFMIVVIPAIIYMTSNNIIVTLFSVVLLIVIPEIMITIMEQKRLNQFEADLPIALTQIAGSIRSGETLINALDLMAQESKSPVADEFALLVKEYRLGKSFESAFLSLTQRINSDSIRIVFAASSIANEVGGNLGEIFERLSVTLTQKKMMEDKIKSLTAQGKLQGIVVGSLPIAMIALIAQIEDNFFHYLTNTYLGWMFIVVMALLSTVGGFMIRKIVTIDV